MQKLWRCVPFAQRRDERESGQRGGLSGGRCHLCGGVAAAAQGPERHPELQRRVLAGHREVAQQENAHPGRHQPGWRGCATRSQQAGRTGRCSGSAAERDGRSASTRRVIAVPAVVPPRGYPGAQGVLAYV